MANGAAVALKVMPSVAPTAATTGMPADVEDEIGRALAGLFALAVESTTHVAETGGISSEVKRQGGELIAALYWAHQKLGKVAFEDMAIRQGQLRLHPYRLSETAADEFTGEFVLTVGRVAAVMAAWAH